MKQITEQLFHTLQEKEWIEEGKEEDEEGLLRVVPVPVVKEKGIVDQFQHVTHVLRVLNTLRDPTVPEYLILYNE